MFDGQSDFLTVFDGTLPAGGSKPRSSVDVDVDGSFCDAISVGKWHHFQNFSMKMVLNDFGWMFGIHLGPVFTSVMTVRDG